MSASSKLHETHLQNLIDEDLKEICRGHPSLTQGANKAERVTKIMAYEQNLLRLDRQEAQALMMDKDFYTVDMLKSLLRGHRFTIGTGGKAAFVERYLDNLHTVVQSHTPTAAAPKPVAAPQPQPAAAPRPEAVPQAAPVAAAKPAAATLHGFDLKGDTLKALCVYLNESNISGPKAKLIGQLSSKVSKQTVQLLIEWLAELEKADIKMGQLRELATPLNIKSPDKFGLVIGLAFAGISARKLHETGASMKSELSPLGMKPKSKLAFSSSDDSSKALFTAGDENSTANPMPGSNIKPCKFGAACKKGDACKFLHVSVPKLILADRVTIEIIEAGRYALKVYYSKPYSKMPDSFMGDEWDYYMDWDPIKLNGTWIERSNHGLAHSMRKAVLVQAVCNALKFQPSEEQLIAMCVAMIFEVCGRESEIGFQDDKRLYSQYKRASIKAIADYSRDKPWFSQDAVEAITNMYYEPRQVGSDAAKMQEVFEIVHELDLFRCYPDEKLRKKVAGLARKVGPQACYELVLRTENQLLATGDRLVLSMMGNRPAFDYHPHKFPRCSLDAEFCLQTLMKIPLTPGGPQAKLTAPPPPKPLAAVPPTPPVGLPPPPKAEPLATRTFKESHYLAEYDATEVPQYQHELFAAIGKLLERYAAKHSIPMAAMKLYFELVQKNAVTAGQGEMFSSKSIPFIAVRLWTTAETLADKIELCSIINRAICMDDAELMPHVAVFARALNMQMVTRTAGKHIQWPMSHMTHRGGSMPREFQSFYTVGKKFRVPTFLATSADSDIAEGFIGRLKPPNANQLPPFQEPVLWTFHFDPAKKCKNVNFIDKTDGSVSGEKEFLFVPYSVFTVQKVIWHAKPSVTAGDYHIVHLTVAPDNAKEPSTLPVSPWS